MGVGFVVRNERGNVMLARCKRFLAGSSVIEVELKSMIWAVQCCWREQLTIIETTTNCKVAVSWLRDRSYCGGLGHIVEDCNLLLEKVQCLLVTHCNREGNKVAHTLAQMGKEIPHGQILWRNIDDMPIHIQLIIRREMSEVNEGQLEV